jgi:hypothetical protein
LLQQEYGYFVIRDEDLLLGIDQLLIFAGKYHIKYKKISVIVGKNVSLRGFSSKKTI